MARQFFCSMLWHFFWHFWHGMLGFLRNLDTNLRSLCLDSKLMLWFGRAWIGMVWHGMVYFLRIFGTCIMPNSCFGMIWHGLVWYGMVWVLAFRFGIWSTFVVVSDIVTWDFR